MTNQHAPSRFVTVTPSQAAAWLRRQELLVAQDADMRNRNVKEDKVKLYARDMAAGDWQPNGEPLIFAANGRILDGQHRLLACVEAEKPFRTLVVEGIAHEAMKTIDTGVVRTMGDQLTIGGKVGGSRLAAALGAIYRWDLTRQNGFDWSARPTRLELWATLEKHPDLERFVSRAGKKIEALMSAGLAGALWYIFDKQDAELAAAFFQALIEGDALKADDPVFLLRERLIRERQQAAIRRVKLNTTMAYTSELVVRAWDATRRGVKLAKLQRGKDDSSRRLFSRRRLTTGGGK